MNNDIYEVTRGDYKSFIEQIIPGCGHVEQTKAGIYNFTYIYSKKTGKKLCGKRTFTGESHKPHPEKYYIYEMPDDDERRDPIPKMKVVLKTREEVQKFFDAISKANKENKND